MNLIGFFASFSSGNEVPGSMSVLAFELPRAITPTIAGLAVGAVVGVFGFIAVLMILGRGSRKSRRLSMPADQVVFIPPYGTMQRDTPMPPQAFQVPPSSAHMHVAAPYARATAPRATAPRATAPRSGHHGHGNVLPFVPSSSLSARAFAKMGYDVGQVADDFDAPYADPFVSIEIDMLDEDDLVESNTPSPPAPPVTPAVTITPVVMLSAPHPLGIINRGSQAMKAAPIADLAFDDSPTEIGETYFDETPQPRRRTDPPKIRAIAPKGPRFPDATPMLPQVAPPPMRAVRSP